MVRRARAVRAATATERLRAYTIARDHQICDRQGAVPAYFIARRDHGKEAGGTRRLQTAPERPALARVPVGEHGRETRLAGGDSRRGVRYEKGFSYQPASGPSGACGHRERRVSRNHNPCTIKRPRRRNAALSRALERADLRDAWAVRTAHRDAISTKFLRTFVDFSTNLRRHFVDISSKCS